MTENVKVFRVFHQLSVVYHYRKSSCEKIAYYEGKKVEFLTGLFARFQCLNVMQDIINEYDMVLPNNG